jgi:biofilm PGA synthesis N-glycosyltransferase PgaC
MDYSAYVSYAFAAFSTLYVIHLGYYLIGANLYDVWQSRRHHSRFREAAKGRAKIYTPLITVAVAAHNEEKVITRCLESIRNSTYKKVQILVVDDCSSDNTYKIIWNYVRKHPELDMKALRKRKNVGKGSALNHALMNYAKGELAMTLDADSVLSPTSLDNAVTYFADETIVGVAANVQILDDFRIIGILQKFEHMIGYRSKKVYSICNCEFVIGGVASTYRLDVLKEVGYYDADTVTEDIGLSMKIISRGNRANRIVYAADVVAMTEGVDTFKGLLRQRFRWKYGSLQNIIKYKQLIGKPDFQGYTTWLTMYRMPMAIISELLLLMAPIVWGYILYWTFARNSLQLIIGTYMTVTAYILITLWFDENTTFRDRIRLSLYAPIAYFIFYIMDFVQLVAMARCIKRSNKLIRQKSVGSVWVSPRRIGREISVGEVWS